MVLKAGKIGTSTFKNDEDRWLRTLSDSVFRLALGRRADTGTLVLVG
jgi:hypothetical protein